MIEIFLRIKGQHYAGLIAFLSFFSLVALPWLVLLTDISFADRDIKLAFVIFSSIGVLSGLTATGMSGVNKKL